MPKVIALGSIGHDNVEYVKDDVLQVSEDEAEELIEAGAARAAADDEEQIEAPVDLPSSFNTPDGKYTTKLNKNGKVSGYLLDGESIKKVEYAVAYEASVEAAGSEDEAEE